MTDPDDPSFCTACGARLVPGQQYCGACGAPVSGVLPGPLAAPPRPAETSGKAIAALVLGIVGVLIVPFVFCSILAIVLARQARREIRADPRLGGDGMATAGTVLGIVGLCVFAVLAFLVLLLTAASQSG